jgi:hypothetical protein
MKYIIITFFLCSTLSLQANDRLLEEIKVLIEQNKIAIEQNGEKIEQNGKKIEQTSQLIEQNRLHIVQVNKQLEFMQNLIYIILGAVFGLPLYLDAKRQREEKEERKAYSKLKDVIFALRELAQDDPKVERSLKVAGIL